MSARSRTILIAAFTVLAAGAIIDEAENWKRLETMPREQRVNLSSTLDRFDIFSSDERASIRELDAAISRLDPTVQSRYRVLLSRYHVWVKGLTDDQKKQLGQVQSAGDKLVLVTKWKRAEVQADSRAKANLIFGVQPGDLGAIPPYEIANALRAWFVISDEEKKKIEKIQRLDMRISELTALGRLRRAGMKPFPAEIESKMLERLSADEKATAVFPRQFAQTKKEAATTKEDPAKAATKDHRLNAYHPVHHLTETLYFSENPPAPVTPANLALFEAQIPTWLRASLDPLPPEVARRRLTILYRQIYPLGQEIPPPAKVDPAKAKAAPSKPSTPKKSGAQPNSF
jgi:hypothetical protein